MKNKAVAIACGGDQANRRELDFYPTPKNVTHSLMKFLHKECDWHFDNLLRIHEPACGNGAMSDVIKMYGHDVYSSDISTSYGATENFLTQMNWNKFDAIITNPPFNLSAEFIEVACKRTKIVCMLLKSQYWHAKGRYELFTKNPPQFILPLTWRPDFSEHLRKIGDKKGQPTMDVAWSVWIKGAHKETRYIPILRP
jgi:hypothetical protein